MKTIFAKSGSVRGDWFVVDATDRTLGRLATQIAHCYRSRRASLASCAGALGRALSEVEYEDFHDAVCIAAMRLVWRPGKARNAVAIAAISANRQADKKT